MSWMWSAGRWERKGLVSFGGGDTYDELHGTIAVNLPTNVEWSAAPLCHGGEAFAVWLELPDGGWECWVRKHLGDRWDKTRFCPANSVSLGIPASEKRPTSSCLIRVIVVV